MTFGPRTHISPSGQAPSAAGTASTPSSVTIRASTFGMSRPIEPGCERESDSCRMCVTGDVSVRPNLGARLRGRSADESPRDSRSRRTHPCRRVRSWERKRSSTAATSSLPSGLQIAERQRSVGGRRSARASAMTHAAPESSHRSELRSYRSSTFDWAKWIWRVRAEKFSQREVACRLETKRDARGSEGRGWRRRPCTSRRPGRWCEGRFSGREKDESAWTGCCRATRGGNARGR